MNKNQLNQDIKNQFSQLKVEINKSLKQLLNNEVEVDINTDEETNLSDLYTENPDQVGIYFVTSKESHQYGHLLFILPEFVTQLYAWIIADKPDETVSEDHLEGLKEAVEQVFGRIKQSMVDENAPSLKDLNVFQTESFEDINKYIEDKEGVTNIFDISVSDVKFQIFHHLIPLEEREDTVEETDVNVQPAEFETISEKSEDNDSARNIDMLMDVELELSVELGRKQSLISDVLKLGKGSILELEKSAGENLDILVNGKKLAEGEVVIIDEHFGIRITQLVSPKERVNLLK